MASSPGMSARATSSDQRAFLKMARRRMRLERGPPGCLTGSHTVAAADLKALNSLRRSRVVHREFRTPDLQAARAVLNMLNARRPHSWASASLARASR